MADSSNAHSSHNITPLIQPLFFCNMMGGDGGHRLVRGYFRLRVTLLAMALVANQLISHRHPNSCDAFILLTPTTRSGACHKLSAQRETHRLSVVTDTSYRGMMTQQYLASKDSVETSSSVEKVRKVSDFIPPRHNNTQSNSKHNMLYVDATTNNNSIKRNGASNQHSTTVDGSSKDIIVNDTSVNPTSTTAIKPKKKNTTKQQSQISFTKSFVMSLIPKHRPIVPFLLPWSFWMRVRSELNDQDDQPLIRTDQKDSNNNKVRNKRWDIPLTSKPFQGFENLRSTIMYCTVAISLYFLIGTLSFPLWLEPSWTFIDSLYFSMTTLTTVGYGDLVVSSSRGIIGKLFMLFFNIYAVCNSVSALGIIAKLALAQERKIISKAKEKARNQLIAMFDTESRDNDADEDDDEEEEDEDEECRWIDHIYDDRCTPPDEPLSMPGVLWQALWRQSFNFVALSFVALLIKRTEGWSLIDLFYFWSSTSTTIGFGDVVPVTQVGRLLAVFFVPMSVVTLGEVIANCFAFITSRAAAKAEKDFLRREITLSDLEYLDIDDDGKVCQLDFVTFMLVAMQKVDTKTMKDLARLFQALDAGKDGYIQKEDLILLRQRKRFAKRLRREARKKKQWYDARMFL